MYNGDTALIHDLNTGASLALWGFRACARDAAQCCVVQKGFASAFNENGPNTLAALSGFVQEIGSSGRRKIWLSPPGTARVSADELSIVTALSAAQAHDAFHLGAHLSWLLACSPSLHTANAAFNVANAFLCGGLIIQAPEVEITPREALASTSFVLHQGGRV